MRTFNNGSAVYLVQYREFVISGEPIYKIGLTTRDIERLKEHKRCKVFHIISVPDCYEMETKLKKKFREIFIRRLDFREKELFEGDFNEIEKLFLRMVFEEKKIFEESRLEKKQEEMNEKKIEDNVLDNSIEKESKKIDIIHLNKYNEKDLQTLIEKNYLISDKGKTRTEEINFLMGMHICYLLEVFLGSCREEMADILFFARDINKYWEQMNDVAIKANLLILKKRVLRQILSQQIKKFATLKPKKL